MSYLRHAVRRAGLLAAVTTAIALTGATTAMATTEPPDGSATATGAAGCTEVTAALDALDELTLAFIAEDAEQLAAIVPTLPELGDEAAAAAPPEIADAVATWVAPLQELVAAVEGVDLSDVEALFEATAAIDTNDSDAALPAVQEWATTTCGWVSASSADDVLADAPEPPDCEVLDPAIAAQAAGVDVDVSDLDGGGDFDLGGLATKSCSYDNGAMSLSTLSFNAIEDAQAFYTDNLENAAGEVLDTDLGALPATSLVIRTGVVPAGTVPSSPPSSEEPATTVPVTVQVAVFEAPIPFSVTFLGEGIDPAQVVAAGEALLAAQATASGAAPSTEAPSTT